VNPSEYQKLCRRTEAPVDPAIGRVTAGLMRLVHVSQGMATEVGEFTDTLKKHLFYGKPLDKVNLTEELGDLCWYIALACNALGISLDDVMAANIAKLRVRYPEKFTEVLAAEENRNRKVEEEAAKKWQKQCAFKKLHNIEKCICDIIDFDWPCPTIKRNKECLVHGDRAVVHGKHIAG
jgi:NTP pyrophosphatase (non-canonical NTP hydrolase)